MGKAAIVSGAIWTILVAGCGGPPVYKETRFLLPDGFRGPIVLIKKPDGAAIQEVGGIISVRVPASGILALSSFQFQEEFTQWRAMTEGGKDVPVEVNQVPDDVVALRGGRFALKQGFDPRLEYFIGTSKEFDQFDFDKWVQANQ